MEDHLQEVKAMNWIDLISVIEKKESVGRLVKDSSYWTAKKDGILIGPIVSVDLGYDGQGWFSCEFMENDKEHMIKVTDKPDAVEFDSSETDMDNTSIVITTAGLNLAVIVEARFLLDQQRPWYRFDAHFPLWKLLLH